MQSPAMGQDLPDSGSQQVLGVAPAPLDEGLELGLGPGAPVGQPQGGQSSDAAVQNGEQVALGLVGRGKDLDPGFSAGAGAGGWVRAAPSASPAVTCSTARAGP